MGSTGDTMGKWVWRVSWMTGAMSAPAFNYFRTKKLALRHVRQLRKDHASASLLRVYLTDFSYDQLFH